MLWLTGADGSRGHRILGAGLVIVITAIDMFKDLIWALGARHSCGHRHDRDIRRTGICRGLIIALMLTGVEAPKTSPPREPRTDQLLNRAPAFAGRIHPVTGEVERIAIEEVKVGDELLVRPQRSPVDGVSYRITRRLMNHP